ncbi:basic proline-rich protein-like [Equus przewalskii]|uniref:Basic proline-rich protein-like n=1 Tax=Equus przewalskii TaxID=9798 RepID=A0ABM4PCJ7_EQUPR
MAKSLRETSHIWLCVEASYPLGKTCLGCKRARRDDRQGSGVRPPRWKPLARLRTSVPGAQLPLPDTGIHGPAFPTGLPGSKGKSSQRGNARPDRGRVQPVSPRALSARQLKEASPCRAGPEGNFSAAPAGAGGRPWAVPRKPAPPAGRCPGPAAAPPRCAEEDAPPPRPPPPAARRPEGRARLRSPETAARPRPRPRPRGLPGLPAAPAAAGARRCPSPRAPTRAGSAGAAAVRPLGSSRARPGPTPRPRPPPLLARQRAGLRGKESERETAPAAAWPVPAPRPPSPCRRERAGSAGPLGSGPIGRGGPRGPGPVPPPRATPPPSNRRRRRWPRPRPRPPPARLTGAADAPPAPPPQLPGDAQLWPNSTSGLLTTSLSRLFSS